MSYPVTFADLSTVFAMLSDIAANIATALDAEYSPAERARVADEGALLKRAFDQWKVTPFASTRELREAMQHPDPANVRIGMVTASSTNLLSRPRQNDELDVPVLHQEVLTGLLNITEEAVRDEHFITYVRGMDAAAAEVREKGAQVAFLLDPTPIDDMARIAFNGGVMPQKSTDFFPKLLTGITIYKL
jgi:hypothetical protein